MIIDIRSLLVWSATSVPKDPVWPGRRPLRKTLFFCNLYSRYLGRFTPVTLQSPYAEYCVLLRFLEVFYHLVCDIRDDIVRINYDILLIWYITPTCYFIFWTAVTSLFILASWATTQSPERRIIHVWIDRGFVPIWSSRLVILFNVAYSRRWCIGDEDRLAHLHQGLWTVNLATTHVRYFLMRLVLQAAPTYSAALVLNIFDRPLRQGWKGVKKIWKKTLSHKVVFKFYIFAPSQIRILNFISGI